MTQNISKGESEKATENIGTWGMDNEYPLFLLPVPSMFLCVFFKSCTCIDKLIFLLMYRKYALVNTQNC